MTAKGLHNHALISPLSMGGGDMSVVIKDCIDIAGHVTSCGSQSLINTAPARQNAVVVDALLAANCRIVGKANMHELAFGMTGVNKHFGTPLNPNWPNLIPGGSSSGSASAVAAGLCDFAIGTDTGGSVRQPAICCGVYGIKPTYDRVSRVGCLPQHSSLDCVGVLARTAQMLTKGLAAIDPTFQPETVSKVPKLSRVKSQLDDQLGEHLLFTLLESVPTAGMVTLPHLGDAFNAAMTLINAEAATAFSYLLDEDGELGEDVRHRLAQARKTTSTEFASAQRMRQIFTAEVDAALQGLDAIITPAMPIVPPTLKEAEDPSTVLPLSRFMRPFNLSGHPAIVLPIKVGSNFLPAGIQIIGHKGKDAALCAIAEWMSSTSPSFPKEDL